MVITWYGQSCFRIQTGNLILFLDPFEKSTTGLQPPRSEANIVLVTHGHKDHNNTAALKGEPFVIDGPGEYEYGGIRVWGIDSFHDDKEGRERGQNTMYALELEGMRVFHTGDLGQSQLTDKQLEAIGEVDVMMVPVGGTYTIDGKTAKEIAHQVEPKIVIPMHYKIKGLTIKLEDASAFLEELGAKEVKPQEKLTLKKNTLPQERMEIVVMSPVSGRGHAAGPRGH